MALTRTRQITVKSPADIAKMRRAGRIVAEVLALVESELRPGISTGELDRLAERHIRAAGAIPSFMGYPGSNPRKPFPASICISIDDEIVHGIPGERTIRAGHGRLDRRRRHRRRLARRRGADLLRRRRATDHHPRADRGAPAWP